MAMSALEGPASADEYPPPRHPISSVVDAIVDPHFAQIKMWNPWNRPSKKRIVLFLNIYG